MSRTPGPSGDRTGKRVSIPSWKARVMCLLSELCTSSEEDDDIEFDSSGSGFDKSDRPRPRSRSNSSAGSELS